jgi:HSP20 family protein
MKLPVRRNHIPSRGPFALLNDLEKDMRRIFDDFSTAGDLDFPKNFAALDVYDKDSHYVVSMDIPGIPKEDINIEVKDGRLRVWGERGSEKKEGDYTERHWGRFERSVPIPADANDSDIEANFENGVLNVALPKTKESKAKKIDIKEGNKDGIWKNLLGKKED